MTNIKVYKIWVFNRVHSKFVQWIMYWYLHIKYIVFKGTKNMKPINKS